MYQYFTVHDYYTLKLHNDSGLNDGNCHKMVVKVLEAHYIDYTERTQLYLSFGIFNFFLTGLSRNLCYVCCIFFYHNSPQPV